MIAIVLTIAVAVMMMASMPLSVEAKGPAKKGLSAEELAFARAVGTGEYEYDIDWVYSYEYGEYEMPLGEAWRGAGSAPAHEYADYLVDEMERIGLQDVKKEPFDVHAYNYGGASVQVLSPEPSDVMLAAGHAGLPGTPPQGITQEIVYVGLGTRFDYADKDVAGKLVMIDVSEEEMFWLQYPLYEAELHGAVGAVVTWLEYADKEGSVATHDSESRTTIPAVSISHADGDYLRALILTNDQPVMVKIWCDAQIDYGGVAYNVYGYIPGTTYPDEYIIIGDHYDKWWYGSSDNGCGLARLLGIAKAMVASGYEPSRTIVFIATDAEEYGWTDTEMDWALGAWWAIFVQHPGWVGKTRGYFNLEGTGDSGATSVYAYGQPETQMFRKSLLPLFNEWFSNNAPWSKYYYRASEVTENLPSVWSDIWSFGSAGIPTMDIGSWRSFEYSGYSYHTQTDTTEWISAESLAMSVISNGIAAIELDRRLFVPLSFQKTADSLDKTLNEDLLMEADIDTAGIYAALEEYYTVSSELWSLLMGTKSSMNADLVNEKLMEAADVVLSGLSWVGGYMQSFYPHQHYQDDSWYMREGIESLQDGNIDRALMWLSWVYGMYHGRLVSYENYKYMQLDRWNIDSFDQFWARGRLATIMDIWHTYDSLLQKKADGVTDYSEEIAALMPVYDTIVANYQNAVDQEAGVLMDATGILEEAKELLM